MAPRNVSERAVGQRGRVALIAVVAVLAILLIGARFVSGYWVDYLWFDSVGRTDVFWTELTSKLSLFFMFGVAFALLAVLNLVIADRLAPTTFAANTHPVVEQFHEFFGARLRSLRIGLALVFGVLFALPAIAQWQSWLQFRNSTPFGIDDAQFGNDVGFYVFRLPFIAFVIDWLFAAMVFVLVLVVFTHVLSGGIVLQPPRPKFRRATKAHVAVLLGVLAFLKAGDYWLLRYELTTANRGAVRGITYAVDNAQLPAVLLLALVSVLTGLLYLSTLKTDKWRPAIVASALWAVVAIVGGVVYPAVVQSLIVKPNQRDREAEYIEYNLEATRFALGIDSVEVRSVEFGSLDTDSVDDNLDALRDIRLVKPDLEMEDLFRNQQGDPGRTIVDLDPDRYDVDGITRQVIVGARELDLDQVGNKSWQGIHLINTHGCGLQVAVAGQMTSTGNPVYRDDVIDLSTPQLYFSPSLGGYAVVRTSVAEQGCEGSNEPYGGTAGVELSGVARRVAHALQLWDYNLLGSSAINSDSRILTVRDVEERAQKVAPFLVFDADPYPVAVDGRVVWVIDAYTTSDRFPYGEFGDVTQLDAGAGLARSFNYVRNSVKVTVDAYDGSVSLYAVDETDPILRVWESVFPDMFTIQSQMPDDLRDNLRYPEELFRVQTAAYSKYRLEATQFFDREGAWSVGLAPPNTRGAVAASTAATVDPTTAAASVSDFAVEAGAPRFEPYYAMFHPEGGLESQFALFRPFQPFSASNERKELSGYMLALREPGDGNGRLVVYEISGTEEGPFTVGAQMFADPEVSADITVFNQQRSVVSFGDLQMVPVAGGVLWTIPMYVESEQTGVPQIRRVIAYHNGTVGYGDSLSDAVGEIFPGLTNDLTDVVGDSAAEPDDPSDPSDPTTPPPSTDATAAELLAEAETLFAEADAALRDSDLATYAAKVEAARDLVARALELLDN